MGRSSSSIDTSTLSSIAPTGDVEAGLGHSDIASTFETRPLETAQEEGSFVQEEPAYTAEPVMSQNVGNLTDQALSGTRFAMKQPVQRPVAETSSQTNNWKIGDKITLPGGIQFSLSSRANFGDVENSNSANIQGAGRASSSGVSATRAANNSRVTASSAPAVPVSPSSPVTMANGAQDARRPAPHPGSNLAAGFSSNAGVAKGGPSAVQGNEAASENSNELDEKQQARRRDLSVEDDAIGKAERQVAAQRYSSFDEAMTGRAEIRRAGVVSKPQPVNFISRANRRFKKSKKFVQAKVKQALKGKSYSGTTFYETLFSDSSLLPNEVSIGSSNLIESLREPNSYLLNLVNKKLVENGEEELDQQFCLMNISVLVEAINRLSIEVTLEKTPVNVKNSVQVRVLRAHYGRGIGLHPTQAKAYNADFDGDEAFLNIDQKNINKHSRAMTILVDAEGKATIDPDFFPIEPISEDKIKMTKDALREDYMWFNEEAANQVWPAYRDLCNMPDNTKSSDEYWADFLRRIDSAAGRMDGKRGENAAQILKAFYDFSVQRRALSLQTQFAPMMDEYEYKEITGEAHPFVFNLIDVVKDISAGKPAPNLQDFTRFYNKYYGDVKGHKNVPFRLLADFAKAINRTDLITIGSDIYGIDVGIHDTVGIVQAASENPNRTITIEQLWQFTCAAGLTKQTSGRMHMGSRTLAVSTQVRTQVLRDVPLPNYISSNPEVAQEQFRNWIDAFRVAYNRHMRMLNISQIEYRNGMTPIRDTSFDGIADPKVDLDQFLKDLPQALVKVYGEKTVERVFPNSILHYGRRKPNGELMKEQTSDGIVYSYRNMSLDKFSINNRLSFKSEQVGVDANGDPVRVPKYQMIKDRIQSGEYTPMDILLLIADRRTKQLGEYHEKWTEATAENFGTLSKIRDDLANKRYNEYAMDMLEFFHLMSPNMFDFFGMDSPITFINSKWGKKLINAKDISEFRSHFVSMMVEYRLNRASQILDELETSENVTTDEMEELDAAFEIELGILGSSSMVWDSIVKDIMGGNITFLALIDDKEVHGSDTTYGSEFYTSERALQYKTLLSFLKSSESFETKINVLADVARVKQQYFDINPKEIMGQLAYHPDRISAGPRFDMDKGLRDDMDYLKNSVERISSYKSKTPEAIRKESEKLLSEARKDKAAFESRLRRFSEDPGYMVHVDTVLAADAISSIYDKTSADAEKNKQQAVVNGYFGAVSLQRSGGYYTHLQQTDNAVLNMVGYDQLTPLDIVRVLGNPEIEITVYDEFGNPAPLSRMALCGGNTIEDVINYLEGNPRISLACRRFIAGVDDKVDGAARMSAMNDMDVFDSQEDQVFSLVNDRPIFLAISALCTPSNGNVGRNITERINENLANLCKFIAAEAQSDNSIEQTLVDIEDVLGVNPDILIAMKGDVHFDGIATDEDYDAVGSLYSEVVGEIFDCIDIVRNSGINLSPVEIYRMSVDESSVVSYYDARQQLNGARTDTMIGVEGSETKKNLVLMEYLRNRPDRFKMSEDGETVVLVEDEESVQDLTLEHNPKKQVGSICKFLQIKREKGAETFNLKFKKFGIDSLNSIIKFFKMGTRSMLDRYGKNPDDTWSIEDGQQLLEQIYSCKTKDEAIPILANALMEADRRLGYVDDATVASDYWNRADLMIAESALEDGSRILVVRSIEQLAVACRNRLSDEAIASGKSDVILSELDNIVNTLGTAQDALFTSEEDVAHRCLYNVQLHSSIGNKARIDRALRQRSSSTERNYALLSKMFKAFDEQFMKDGKTYEPPSRNAIDDKAMKMLGKLRGETRKRVEEIANPKYKNSAYDYLGSSDDPETRIYPGPQNLVLFKTQPDLKRNGEMIDLCKKYGVTAAFENITQVPAEFVEDAIWTGGLYILPFFDMKLNGMMSAPIAPAPGVFPFNPDNAVVNVEDTTFEFKPGDATYHPTKELVDRVRVNYRGEQKFNVDRLFPNVLRTYPDSDYQMDFCNNDEIQKYIVNGSLDVENMTINGFAKASIDLGIGKENSAFDHEAKRFEIRLNEFVKRFNISETDQDGFLRDTVSNDSIVGFVKIVVDNKIVAFAPIWPFHLEESGRCPTSYKVEKVEFDNDSHSFVFRWRYEGDLKGQYIKAFEGIGASNKMITASEYAKSRTLANGLAVDGFYSTKSVSSRLFASNKRIHTMITLMMITRLDANYAYNFAELDGCFPENPTFENEKGETVDIRQALLNNDMRITDWKTARKSIDKFHNDPEIDAIVKYWVDKCLEFGTVNPSILLATKTSEGITWPMMTEFEAFMDTSPNFENAFLKLMNSMNKSLCPASIDGNANDCLFIPVTTNMSEDYGVLQMMVPHYDETGKEYRIPENVYISFGFFGDEFSGFKQVNINGYNRASDSLNVAYDMNGFELSQVMVLGRAEMSGIHSGLGVMKAVPDAIMEPNNNQDR